MIVPRVTVCILSYQQGAYLESAIQSVLNQSFEDWELIVLDNGSTDESRTILRSYAAHPKIEVILHDSNDAPTKRLNEAIKAGSGEFVSILYSDDYYLPHKLEVQVKLFDQLPEDYGFVYGPGRRLDVDTGEEWIDATTEASGWVFDDLLRQHGRGLPINPISPLIRRTALNQHPFLEDLFIEGELIFFRIALTHRFQFHPEVTVVMRDHHNNIGRSTKRNVDTLLAFLEKLERDPDFPAESGESLRLMRANLCRLATWVGVRAVHDPIWAREMARRAVRFDRRQAVHPKILLGVVLSVLPAAQLRTLDSLVSTLRPTRGHRDYVER